MSIFMDDKGSALLAIVAVMLGLLLGIFAYNDFDAEAVIGGIGNVSDNANPHNFSAGSAGVKATSEDEICIFCHTPHQAVTDSSLINAPLWNHTLSTATYAVKNAGIFNYTTAQGKVLVTNINLLTSVGQPDGASKLCLSCHDGTVAVGDVYSRMSNIPMDSSAACSDSAGRIPSSGCSAYIGTNLQSKHVVSVAMNDDLKTRSLQNCNLSGQYSKLKYPWDAPANANVVLRPTKAKYNGKSGVSRPTAPAQYKNGYHYGVQCSTCHDPHLWHDSTPSGDTNVPGVYFLVDSFSNICRACHVRC